MSRTPGRECWEVGLWDQDQAWIPRKCEICRVARDQGSILFLININFISRRCIWIATDFEDPSRCRDPSGACSCDFHRQALDDKLLPTSARSEQDPGNYKRHWWAVISTMTTQNRNFNDEISRMGTPPALLKKTLLLRRQRSQKNSSLPPK